MIERKIKALRYLYINEFCYKTDFVKLLNANTKKTTYTNEYDRLKTQIKNKTGREGFIEKKIDRQGKKYQKGEKDIIISLTTAGLEYYQANEKDEFYRNLSVNNKDKKSLFNTRQQNKKNIFSYLTSQKVSILYSCADCVVLTYDKPSLYLIEELFNANPGKINRDDVKKITKKYIDARIDENMSDYELKRNIKEILDGGIYYSKDEVREYLKSIKVISNNTEARNNLTDSFKAIRWNGIYITSKHLYINFVLPYGENVRLSGSDAEFKNMLSVFSRYIAINKNDIQHFRSISCISDGKEIYHNSIDAITIGIGNSHTYTEAIGKKYGRIKNPKKIKSSTKVKDAARRYDMLDCHSNNFKRIYSISDNAIGIQQLNYIANYSIEEYYDEEKELLFNDSDERFIPSPTSNLFPAIYENLNISAIYLPVYEIKLLNKISQEFRKNNRALVVCTYKSMFETISHCLRIDTVGKDESGNNLPGLYFIEVKEVYNKQSKATEIKLGNIFNYRSGEFNLYDEYGYIKGKRILDEYLKSHGNIKLNSEKEYGVLASTSRNRTTINRAKTDKSESTLNKTRLYNMIAVTSDPDKYCSYLMQHIDETGKSEGCAAASPILPPVPKEKKISNNYQLQISLSADLKSRIRKMANKHSLSSSALIRQAITTALKAAEDLDEAYDYTNADTTPWKDAQNEFKKAISKKIGK